MHDAVGRLAEAKGILPRYKDVTGTVRDTSQNTAIALLTALGEPVGNAADRLREIEEQEAARNAPPWMVVDSTQPPDFNVLNDRDWRLELENGQCHSGRGSDAFPQLPLGIHRLWINGAKTVLLAAPPRLPLPDRSWGLMVPLWGMRGVAQGGLGDFADLADLARHIGGTGPGFLGINPIHAGFPTVDAAYSPYQPSHRRRLNVMHVPISGAASNGPLIDYPAEFALRRAAQEEAFLAAKPDARFDAFCDSEGPALRLFASHQALSDQLGPYWTDWPAKYHDTAAASEADPERVRFLMWLQWQADLALGAARDTAMSAGLKHGLYLDLAVGTHPAGAETWEDGESFVRNVSLGAPPDALGPEGQVWNLAPFNPAALIEKDFQPLAETLRMQFRYGSILRIDHILGFERAFLVPSDGSPGAYMQMPRDAMLAVARIEAARAGGVVVGEDLGVVPDGLRDALETSGILGCRVAMFERDGPDFRDPVTYPEASIASFSTHDLPTWAGWRGGQDLKDWAALGAISPDTLRTAQADRNKDVDAFDKIASNGVHEALAGSTSRLVAVQAEVLFDMVEQPNLPGTVTEYPNWRHRLPAAASEMTKLPSYAAAVSVMKDAGR